jgi:ketosteroid isomerase-like protein
MSDQTQKNMQVLKHWFETVSKGDIAKMMKELAEIITKDYLLHDPSAPNLQPGREKCLESFEQDIKNMVGIRVNIENMFGVEDKVATQGIFEWLDVKTQERKKMMGIVISRFENGKLAEEWQVLAPFS